MNDVTIKLDQENILALDKVIDLIKEFSDKNPIKKYKFNYKKIKERVNQLKELKNRDNYSKQELYDTILRKLKVIIKREFHPEIYFIIGGHGGVIINDIGFCEFDSPKFALNCLIEKMELAIKTNMPYHIEIAISCLEWLQCKYPELFSKFLRLYQQGKFEIINPTYSQPYSLIIGPESNIKQIEYGMNILKKLKLECNIYYCSESSLHPQIPQIIKGFKIDFASLRTRLLGSNPTSSSGKIDWIGLDNTKINTITEQSGVFNGEYWHGTFFREIPNLLFQSISRPFMKYILYSSIEDFVMSQPYQEEIWRISRFSEIFGKFISCSEFFQLADKEGEYQYNRDNFVLGDNIFIPSKLFLKNKYCEMILITAEILNCILGLFHEKSTDSFFEDLWKKLLLTQAHDNYAVPFIRSGDYSVQQLMREQTQKFDLKNNKVSISELSIEIQEEIWNQCTNYIHKALSKLAENIGSKFKSLNDNTIHFLVFNPTVTPRRDSFSIQLPLENPSNLTLIGDNKQIPFQYQDDTLKFIAEISGIGFGIFSLIPLDRKISQSNVNYFYEIRILEDLETIEISFKDNKICDLKFQCKFEYQLSLKNHSKDGIEDKKIIEGIIMDKLFKVEIIQYNGVNRIEFFLDSNLIDELILIPSISITKCIINYPFGVEETRRSNIQTLDFLWLTGKDKGIIFMQKNSQKFKIDRNNFIIRNFLPGNGRFEFALSITNYSDINSVLNYSNCFKFKLQGIKVKDHYKFRKRSGNFLSLELPVTLINLWRRKNDSFLRVFNASNKQNNLKVDGLLIKNSLTELDFNYNEIKSLKHKKSTLNPWKIKTYKF